MEIKKLKQKIPREIYDRISKFKELRPPQEEAIKKGILEGKDIIISSPTGSGKTLIAEMAIINNYLKNNKKSLYIVPLRSLAMEKYESFSKNYPWLKIAISIGDLDSSDPWLKNYDIIIVTSEKMDSLIRHGVNWIKQVGTIVIDEIHMIGDEERGPTLEVLITMLRKLTKAQIVGLSATISNAKEIADWLNAKIVKSDYRPIKLKEGVYCDGKIYFKNEKEGIEEKFEDEYLNLVLDALKKDKQVLIFFMSRRNAEAAARKCSQITKKFLEEKEKKFLEEKGEEILHSLEHPTEQCKKVSKYFKDGSTFHHAGLVSKQRKTIEDAFRKRILKVICATPTLALGVNLPTWRAIVRDMKRYSEEYGQGWIPVLEWKQMIGRAGRPGLEKFGEGVCIAKNENESEFLMNKYVLGKPENIYSKLSSEPALRSSILGLISISFVNSEKSTIGFFKNTFFAKQYKDETKLIEKIESIIELLKEIKFVKGKEFLEATRIGRRVSELYVDPLSAKYMIEMLKKEKYDELFYLQVINNCYEMPIPSIGKKDFFEVQSEIRRKKNKLPPIPEIWDIEYERFLRGFKNTKIFYDWINEKGEDYILEKYNETPGRLYSKLNIADWLLYSMEELAKILKKKKHIREIRKLRVRLKYGIKEELIELVQLKGIGRVKARKLYKAGIKNIEDLKKKKNILKEIIGKKTAENVLKQLGG